MCEGRGRGLAVVRECPGVCERSESALGVRIRGNTLSVVVKYIVVVRGVCWRIVCGVVGEGGRLWSGEWGPGGAGGVTPFVFSPGVLSFSSVYNESRCNEVLAVVFCERI